MQEKRVALVTGANKGIGLQIAKDLAKHNLIVLAGARNIDDAKAAAESVGGNAHAIQLDVTDQVSIDAAADRIRKEFGRLDILMNNAGISRAAIGRHLRKSRRLQSPDRCTPRRHSCCVRDECVWCDCRYTNDAAAAA